MKKTLALLLCLAMLFTALSVNVFAAGDPAVTVVTHSTPASGTTDFAISLANFSQLKGFDLVVTATGGIEFTGVSSVNTKTTALEADKDYTISDDKKTLHIVDLVADAAKTVIITVNAAVTADAEINVTAHELAKDGTTLHTGYTVTGSSIVPYVAPQEIPTEPDETVEEQQYVQQPAEEDYFIPYGSVYSGTPTAPVYVAKNNDGTFNLDEAITVNKFKKPADGFGTFGVSPSLSGAAKQFGHYAEDYLETNTYGTLVVVGDWVAFKNWYLSYKGYGDQELGSKLYNAYKNALANNPDAAYVKFTGGDNSVKVYNVVQNNYMWRNIDAKLLEYAVRVSGLKSDTSYAAIAYCESGSNVKISSDIRSFTN